jgi:TRAP-type C4-dicarboxylate transport system permease small subunit
MQWIHRLNTLLDRLYDKIGSLVGIIIGLFAVAISVDLFLRLSGVGNLPGLQEVVEYLLYAGVFLGSPWVLRVGGHTFVDVLITNLSRGQQRQLQRVLHLVGAIVSGVITYFGAMNCLEAFHSGALQMKYFNVPEWWLLAVFVVSFGLLTLEFLLKLTLTSAPSALSAAELT